MSKPSPFNEPTRIAPAKAFFGEDTNIDTTENINTNVSVDTNTNVDICTNVNRYTKRERFEDNHTRQTYYIAKDLIQQLNEFAGNERGVKTKFINDAIREHLKRVKNKPTKWDERLK